MAFQSFFDRKGPFTLARLAETTASKLPADADAGLEIHNVAPFLSAREGEVTFLADRKLMLQAEKLQASACFVMEDYAQKLPEHVVALVTPRAEEAFAMAIAAFYPGAASAGTRLGAASPAGTFHVDDTARLEDGVVCEPGAVIGPEAEIGGGTIICANAVIGAKVKIGRDCVIGPGASILHALIGNQVIVHGGARIGEDGFGFAAGARGFVKLAQVGRVIIQDDVEVGANATIDRGALSDTVIGQGTKIDNLVQIAHNVQIGRSCAFAGQAGLSGSSTVGDGVVMGGQAGTIPHVKIGSGAQVAAGTGVARNVDPGARVAGRPHRSFDRFLRELRAIARLSRDDSAPAR